MFRQFGIRVIKFLVKGVTGLKDFRKICKQPGEKKGLENLFGWTYP